MFSSFTLTILVIVSPTYPYYPHLPSGFRDRPFLILKQKDIEFSKDKNTG